MKSTRTAVIVAATLAVLLAMAPAEAKGHGYGAVTRAAIAQALDGGTLNFSYTQNGDLTLNGDLTVTGQIEGIPKLKMICTTLTDPAHGANTTVLGVDDWILTWGWAAKDDDAGGEAASEVDASVTKYGADSLRTDFLAGADWGAGNAGDGLEVAGWGGSDFTGVTSFGAWVRSSVALSAGDLSLTYTDADDGAAGRADSHFAFPAVPAGVWTWVEIDISALAAPYGDQVDSIQVTLVADLGAFSLWLDSCVQWDAADETALGLDLLAGGVLSATWMPNGTLSTHTWNAVSEGLDYWPLYKAGDENDTVLLTVTAASWVLFVAHD